VAGEFDDVEPVAADLRGRVSGKVAAGDVQAGGLRVARGKQGALQYQRSLVLPPVEAGVVDTDRGTRGQFDREGAVTFPERLAPLRTRELDQAHDRVVGDHRHRERGLDQAALLGGDALRAGGAQGVREGRVEGVVVDRADVHGLRAADVGRVGHGAGVGDAAQLGAAVGEARRGLVAGQEALVEVDGGEVAEARDGHVEEFTGRGLQVERVADARARLVQKGEIAPCLGCLAGGGAARGDVGAQPGDAYRTARTAVHAIEVDGPVATLAGTGHGAADQQLVDHVAGLQDTAQNRGDTLGLAR
jgi:hypothetical protein